MMRITPGVLLLFAAATGCAAPAAISRDVDPVNRGCAFPAEAAEKKIDSAVVTLRVRVNAVGVAVGVRILEDPGNGFGQAAARCAMEQIYTPALDSHGTPYLAETPPLHMRFTR